MFDWSPVKNLDFVFDAICKSSHQSTLEFWSAAGAGAPSEQRRRLQRPHSRRPLVLSERVSNSQISAPEQKLRGFLPLTSAKGADAAPVLRTGADPDEQAASS